MMVMETNIGQRASGWRHSQYMMDCPHGSSSPKRTQAIVHGGALLGIAMGLCLELEGWALWGSPGFVPTKSVSMEGSFSSR